jgi:ATP-dependent Lon protease
MRELIALYTREAGVRRLEQQLAALCRKTAAGIVAGDFKSRYVRAGALEDLLGPAKYKDTKTTATAEVGLVHGLAWTRVGGEMLDAEVGVMDGTGKLELTGNLGDVMKESARAALSYIRSRAKELGVDPDFYKTKDIHIHFPEGAVPKDGPSAGVTITTGLVSALTNTPVRQDVAMTGEVTLRGRVLPIGGLREKTMAALRAGIHTVIIPADNEPDLAEIDQTVRAALNFITASRVEAVLDAALCKEDDSHEI